VLMNGLLTALGSARPSRRQQPAAPAKGRHAIKGETANPAVAGLFSGLIARQVVGGAELLKENH